MVLLGLVIACRLAICPTRRSSVSVKATIEGVVRLPSELGITIGSPPSITATQLLVVPRSIPITLAIWFPLLSRIAERQPGLTRPGSNAMILRTYSLGSAMNAPLVGDLCGAQENI